MIAKASEGLWWWQQPPWQWQSRDKGTAEEFPRGAMTESMGQKNQRDAEEW